MFPDELLMKARDLSDELRSRRLMLATAESCTGGLISCLLTELAGSSDVFDRGFVTYSNDAKHELLGVPLSLIEKFGAVSREVAEAMAAGAVKRSQADIGLSVTGVAGPDGGTQEKPVGLVHIGGYRKDGVCLLRQCRFGDIGRTQVRMESVHAALDLAGDVLAAP